MRDDSLPRTTLGWLPYLWNSVLFPGQPDTRTAIRWPSLLVLVLLPAALLYPTRSFHLLEPDEGRYAQIPKEMLERGEWVVPTLQGEAYLDKPPLMYWLTALSYRAFGVSPESARLVPALCVHFTILLVYLLGRRSIGERAAFWAALLLTVAPGFTAIARFLLLDGLLTLCVTLSVMAGFEAVRTGALKPGWWILSAVASGLGFLTKGPIAEVLLFVPLWVFGFLNRGTARVRWFHYVLFFGIVFLVNLPWYVGIYLREPEFLKHFFWEHNVLRFVKPFDHLQPVWFYVPILAAGLLPGTILLGMYAWKLLRGDGADAAKRSSAGGFWLLAGAWCVFFFSCSGSKLPTYVLPAYPFLCLALGEFVARRTHREKAVLSPCGRGQAAAEGVRPGEGESVGQVSDAFAAQTPRSPGVVACEMSPSYVATPHLITACGGDLSSPARGEERCGWSSLKVSASLGISLMASLLLVFHHVALPWYARERSPFGKPDLVRGLLEDRSTTVVCFPRHVNSLAFYMDRSDMANVHTRDVNQLFVDCHHRPRTVILFTHRDSLAGFRNTLPPSLQIVEHVPLRRTYSHPLLTKLLGVTPWGLCDIAVVTPTPGVAPAPSPRPAGGAE